MSCDGETSQNYIIYPNELYYQNGMSHGTLVASVVGCQRNNGIQMAGVAPDVQLMPISFKSTRGLIFGINWAWRMGADVINCSWSKTDGIKDVKIEEAMDSALYRGRSGKGCIIVFASGNKNAGITYPARYNKDILVVGAIDSIGNRYYKYSNPNKINGSCFGIDLDVIAPGVGIKSLDYNNVLRTVDGTSLAAPHVAGVAAMILERNQDLTGQQVRDIIEQNTVKVGHMPYQAEDNRPNGTWNEEYGYGLIDAYKALLATHRKQENY